MTLLIMQGKGHTDGIVACVSAALINLTSHAAPAPPRAVTEPEQPVPYYSGVPPAPPAALLRWEGVLMLSAVALLVTVAGWLLLRLTRCSVDCWRGVRASRHTQKKLMCAPAEPVWPVQPSSARACVVAADDLDIRSEHPAHLKKGHRRCHSAPVRVSPSSLATLAHSKGEAVGAMAGAVGSVAEAGRPTCDTRRVTTRALRRARTRPPCAQQRRAPPSPSPQG